MTTEPQMTAPLQRVGTGSLTGRTTNALLDAILNPCFLVPVMAVAGGLVIDKLLEPRLNRMGIGTGKAAGHVKEID